MKRWLIRRIPGWIAFVAALLMLVPHGAATAQKLRTLKYSTRSAKKAVLWQEEVRNRMTSLLNLDDLLAQRTSIPLDLKEIRSENKGDYLLREVEISSTASRRIRLLVTYPLLSTGPWPAVICFHGHDGKPASVYDPNPPYLAFGEALARRNYVTVAPAVSQHEVFESGRTLMGERIWDGLRSVDFALSCFSVDTARIGCAGVSLGGEMAMWLGALEPRIKVTVSSGFLTRMDQLEQGHCLCWKFPGLREAVDFADIYALIAPRALLCQNGVGEPPDGFRVDLARIALKEIEVIYYNFGHPENLLFVPHPEGHVMDLVSMVSFFKKHFRPIKSALD